MNVLNGVPLPAPQTIASRGDERVASSVVLRQHAVGELVTHMTNMPAGDAKRA